jgi:hypothetical protein
MSEEQNLIGSEMVNSTEPVELPIIKEDSSRVASEGATGLCRDAEPVLLEVVNPLLDQDSKNEEEPSDNRTRHNPELTLCILRGGFKKFFYKAVFDAMRLHSNVKSVLIKPQPGRFATYGFAFFETVDDVKSFLDVCTYDGVHNAHILNVEDQSLIFKEYKVKSEDESRSKEPRNYERSNQQMNRRPRVTGPKDEVDNSCKTIFVKNLPPNEAQLVLNDIFKNISIESMTIFVKPEHATATVVMYDEVEGRQLVDESFRNKGISYGNTKITIHKFNSSLKY